MASILNRANRLLARYNLAEIPTVEELRTIAGSMFVFFCQNILMERDGHEILQEIHRPFTTSQEKAENVKIVLKAIQRYFNVNIRNISYQQIANVSCYV